MINSELVKPYIREETEQCYFSNPFDLLKCKSNQCPKYDSCLEFCNYELQKRNNRNETARICFIVRDSHFKSSRLYHALPKNQLMTIKEMSLLVNVSEEKIKRLISYMLKNDFDYPTQKVGKEYIILERAEI